MDSETKNGKHRERMEREMGAVRVGRAEGEVPARAGGFWWFPQMGRVSETITPTLPGHKNRWPKAGESL